VWTQDLLAAADVHLDLVEKRMRDLNVVDRGAVRYEAAFARPAVREHMRRPGAIVERAHSYVAAARQAVGDIVDDMRDAPGRVGEDLRLLGQVCAMVDELGTEATRHLAAVDRQVTADPDPNARLLGLMLASDARTLQVARSSARAAGRIAHELAEDLPRLPVATSPLGREHQHRQPRRLALGPTGPPR